MGDDRPRGIRYNASPRGNEEILAARRADGGMALLIGMGQEDAASPHPLPIGGVRPQDAAEIARVARLLALPGTRTVPPLWTTLLPPDEGASDEGRPSWPLIAGGASGAGCAIFPGSCCSSPYRSSYPGSSTSSLRVS